MWNTPGSYIIVINV